MRAHQIMAHPVISVTPDTPVTAAATVMLENHISGLPVLDKASALVGIISESDFLRRSETGTGRKRSSWSQFFTGTGKAAEEYVREHGRRVDDVMTPDPVTVSEQTPLDELVHLMEKHNIKRLPVVSNGAVVGIVTRSNLLRAVAGLAKDIPDPTADDDRIRERITRAINDTLWRPIGLQVTSKNGVVHLYGIVVDDRSRSAATVAAENTAGVREIHDHLTFVNTYSGMYVDPPETVTKVRWASVTELRRRHS